MDSAEKRGNPPSLPARQGGRRIVVFAVSVVTGTVLGWVVAAALSYVQPRQYESQAVFQIHADSLELEQASPSEGRVLPPLLGMPEFDLSSEVAVLKSGYVLGLVAERLKLAARWDEEPEIVVDLLTELISVERIPGTELVTIRARHANPNDARDIADKLPSVYMERRSALAEGRAEKALMALDAELRDQEDLVEDKRKIVDTIGQAMGVPYLEDEAIGLSRGSSVQLGLQEASAQLRAAELEQTQITESLTALDTLEGEELTQFVAALEWEYNPVDQVDENIQIERKVLDRLRRSGLEEEHPVLVRQRALLEVLTEERAPVMEQVRVRLNMQARLVRAKVERLRKLKSERRDRAVDAGLESHDLNDAKREYESAVVLRQEAKQLHVAGRVAMKIPRNYITVHEVPKVGRIPVSPEVDKNLSLGLVWGLAVGLLVGGCLLLTGRRSGAVPTSTVPAYEE